MFQQGTKNLYVYLPMDSPQMRSFADLYEGVFDKQFSRWKFPNTHKKKILSELETPPLDSGSESEPEEVTSKHGSLTGSDNDGDDLSKSPLRMDKRLHRAQSFSRYESDSEGNSDNEDFKLNLDHKARKKLSPAQFNFKRHKISQCIENCKHESATRKVYDN
jgi:hypothetical protein